MKQWWNTDESTQIFCTNWIVGRPILQNDIWLIEINFVDTPNSNNRIINLEWWWRTNPSEIGCSLDSINLRKKVCQKNNDMFQF